MATRANSPRLLGVNAPVATNEVSDPVRGQQVQDHAGITPCQPREARGTVTRRITDAERRYIALFEDVTGVPATDCVVDDTHDRVVFVVPSDAMSRAIGPDGSHVRKMEERVGRDVELIADAETPADFVANALRPAAVYHVATRERDPDASRQATGDACCRVAYAEVDAADMGAAIGADGRNVEMARRLAKTHHDVDVIELVPDADSVIERVEAASGVEPIDCIFDPTDERLLVVVPPGSVSAVVGESGEGVDRLSDEFGWPLEVVEYASDPAAFVENALAPAEVRGVTLSENRDTVAYVEVAAGDEGRAIGRGGRTIRRARLLADLFHGVADVQLT